MNPPGTGKKPVLARFLAFAPPGGRFPRTAGRFAPAHGSSTRPLDGSPGRGDDSPGLPDDFPRSADGPPQPRSPSLVRGSRPPVRATLPPCGGAVPLLGRNVRNCGEFVPLSGRNIRPSLPALPHKVAIDSQKVLTAARSAAIICSSSLMMSRSRRVYRGSPCVEGRGGEELRQSRERRPTFFDIHPLGQL
jgi:hypothetical protein